MSGYGAYYTQSYTPTGYVPQGQRMSSVDCGGHYALSCGKCVGDNGPSWCNGDCEWIVGFVGGGECVARSGIPGLPDPRGGLLTDAVWWLALFGLSAFIMLIYAFVYKTQVIDRLYTIPKHHFTAKKLNLFACFAHPQTLVQTFFCMPVVAGKNYEAAGVLGFWPGCLFTFIFTNSPLYLFGVCFRAILAKKVQDRIGHETSLVKTFLTNLVCMPCDIGKESLEVDQEIGADIKCCCNLTQTPIIFNEVDDVKSRMCDNSFGRNRCCGA
eukprot:CAMPEP_0170220898 /NCGR_PEP_ID=MMETSP0116_2-20130129/10137_1 /TAXON_ID=400756 /ORGANISM="Durinskia baltica, Strain CSIRO CS-38" /LENGTH=268 /DNA_ID=CAMNT_0010471577 /DNA_START=69 /DNA_END=875 /DNA_ORIENTATION=+